MIYNESYEEYIRSILGYPSISKNINTYNTSIEDDYYFTSNTPNNRNELEDMYPEIYKIIYPMITKRCSEISEPITKDLLDNITDELHSAIETNNEINLNININNQVKANRNDSNSEYKHTQINEPVKENRQVYNRDLRDLIKILLIRELVGRPGFRPNPPHRPPIIPPYYDGRPPFPGPGPRPPIRPREYPNEFYEQY